MVFLSLTMYSTTTLSDIPGAILTDAGITMTGTEILPELLMVSSDMGAVYMVEILLRIDLPPMRTIVGGEIFTSLSISLSSRCPFQST